MGMAINNNLFQGFPFRGLAQRRIDVSNPLGEAVRTEGVLTEGVASESKSYDPYSARHNLGKACCLLSIDYTKFANQCKKKRRR